MKLLEFLKEKIMPRPKGSKNKEKAVVTERPREFDYERDDLAFDNAYRPAVTSAEARPEPTWSVTNTGVMPGEMRLVTSIPAYADVEPSLYLVEGDVQLQPRIPGRGSMVAKQTRLVRATSEMQAVEKYSVYFRNLGDAEASYVVLRAAAMEVID